MGLVVVVGLISPAVGLVAALAAFLPYLALLGMGRRRLLRTATSPAVDSLALAAVHEEELELEVGNSSATGRATGLGNGGDRVVVVVVASVAMEHTATRPGARHAVPGIVVGGLVLAAVTSLPNAVAAVYFAARGKGAAVLSTALNSNAINVVAGFLVPASALGLGSPSGSETLIAAAYAAMTAVALVIAYANRGLRRGSGALIIAAYLAVAVVLVLTA